MIIQIKANRDVELIELGAQYIIDVDELDPEARISPPIINKIQALQNLVDKRVEKLLSDSEKDKPGKN